LLIVLNNGDYEAISLTAWIAANPQLLLAANFGVPESSFANFPNCERGML
jgi:oxalate decarboxylase